MKLLLLLAILEINALAQPALTPLSNAWNTAHTNTWKKPPYTFEELRSTITTNWQHTSTTHPVRPDIQPGGVTTLIYYATTYHYTGTILSNTVLPVTYKGKKHEFVVESVEIGRTNKAEMR
jgi:hypothetical protein